MVGGDAKAFETVKPILEKMGSSVVRVGDIGAGNVTKLANQIIVALNIAAVSEAFVLATKAGVNPEAVFNAIKGGLAGSTVMNAKVPMILDGNFKPGFRIELHIKDLQNALDTAHALNVPVPLTANVMETLQALKNDDFGANDHSAIVRHYEKLRRAAVNLAITPDESMALVANSSNVVEEGGARKLVPDNRLWVIDLTTSPPAADRHR